MFYVITDTHLGHKSMIRSCGRPENFTSLILRNCKQKVKASDTVIHLGDVAWDPEAMLRMLKLPGRKILVKGNHDKGTMRQYLEAGFDLVVDSMTVDFDGMKVLFSHEPIFGHTASINVHGHQHDLHREDVFRLYWPLALEHMGYRPVALNDDVLHHLHSWVDRQHVPSLQELIALRQDYIGEPLLRDYIGGTTGTMGKPLVFIGENGETHEVGMDDLICVHWREVCLFLAMRKRDFDRCLGETCPELLQLPWPGEEFASPRKVLGWVTEIEKAGETPFPVDCVLVWVDVGLGMA